MNLHSIVKHHPTTHPAHRHPLATRIEYVRDITEFDLLCGIPWGAQIATLQMVPLSLFALTGSLSRSDKLVKRRLIDWEGWLALVRMWIPF